MKREIPFDPAHPYNPDFENIENGGLREFTTIDEKALHDKKIQNFKDSLCELQPPFIISKESWNMLIEGKYENGDSWLPPNYEVYAFVFCIAQTSYGEFGESIFYFRIRSIIRSILAPIDLERGRIPNILQNVPSPFKTKRKSKPKPNLPEIEISNIACFKLNFSGNLESFKFIREGDEEINQINKDVATWKNGVTERGDELQKGRLNLKLPYRNFSPSHSNTHLDPTPLPKEVKSNQEGVIFSKKRIKEILENGLSTKIEFALDFEDDAPKDPNGYYNPIKFVFTVKPAIHVIPYIPNQRQFNLTSSNEGSTYVTDGLPCPTPPVCINE